MQFNLKSLTFIVGTSLLTSIAMATECTYVEMGVIGLALASPAYLAAEAAMTTSIVSDFEAKIAAYYSAHNFPLPDPSAPLADNIDVLIGAMKTMCHEPISNEFIKIASQVVDIIKPLPNCTLFGKDYKSGGTILSEYTVEPFKAACGEPSFSDADETHEIKSIANIYLRGTSK